MGFGTHVFISYAHNDNDTATGAWVSRFHELLEGYLRSTLKRTKPVIWRDKRLADNEVFDASIMQNLADSAVMVAVLWWQALLSIAELWWWPLPDTLRVPLLMSDMDQLSCQEIAETLGLGLSAVKMRIKRGREAFRSRYAGMSPPARQPAPDLP